MQMTSFDTLTFAKELESAGMPRPQAEVIARVQLQTHADILERLATKEEAERNRVLLEGTFRKEMKELEVSIRKDMKEMESQLRLEIAIVFSNYVDTHQGT